MYPISGGAPWWSVVRMQVCIGFSLWNRMFDTLFKPIRDQVFIVSLIRTGTLCGGDEALKFWTFWTFPT